MNLSINQRRILWTASLLSLLVFFFPPMVVVSGVSMVDAGRLLTRLGAIVAAAVIGFLLEDWLIASEDRFLAERRQHAEEKIARHRNPIG